HSGRYHGRWLGLARLNTPRHSIHVNYRHAYHAGNHGDVLKHAALTEIVQRLLEKTSPFFVLDTHAGIGVYDLAAAEPGKTGEWENGIGELIGSSNPVL